MKLKTTSADQLMELCQDMGIPLIDINVKDKIIFDWDGCYIINLESQGEGFGSHWTCGYLKGSKFLYYDPFGAVPPADIVKKLKKTISYSTSQIQDIKSKACGYFCLLFLHYCTTNYNRYRIKNDLILDFNSFFSSDTKKNDDLLSKMLSSII